MRDEKKTKQQLLNETTLLRQKIARLEKSHKLREKQHARILEGLSEGIWITDKDWRTTSVNSRMQEIIGYTKEETVGKSLFSFMDNDSAEMCKRRLERIKKHGARGQRECEFVTKDGKRVCALIRVSPLIDDEGNFSGSIACMLDITKHKKALKKRIRDITERKMTEERLRIMENAIASSINAIGITDLDGKVIYVNDSLVKMWGYEQKEEILGRNLPEFWEGDRVLKTVKDLHEKGGSVGFDTGKRKDGSLFPAQYSASMIKDDEGNAQYMLGSFIDITDLMQAEEELRKLSRAVQQSPVSIIITNLNGVIEYVNPKFTEVTHYTYREVVGRNARILKSGKHTPEFYKHLWKTIKSGREWRGEFLNKKKNGELYWEHASISPITNPAGKITHFLGVNEDITERKRLEEQLFQAQKMDAIGTLAGGVAHDFNNHLTIIIGYCDYLLMLLNKNNQARKRIEEIKKAGERAASLTQQLLAFSRRQMLQPKVLDTNELVAEMEKMLRRLIGEDIVLITYLEPELWYVKADEAQLEQVVMNLAVNAKEAMPEGGKLTLKTENVTIDRNQSEIIHESRPGNFVCLSVEDTGIGMDRETISHIFDPFFTTKKGGTGLGLSVTYGIVKQHEGWINVYSASGVGSAFKVYLPVSSTMPEETDEAVHSLKEFCGTGEKVLLVEDEEMVRDFASETLTNYGYVVFEAGSAEEALDVFKKEKGEFNVIFSDVVLPDITGIDLVDKLLSLNPNIKVLMSSGYFDRKSKWPVIQEKGFVFIQKPYTIADLLKSLREAIELS